MGCLALAEPLVSVAPHASVGPARPARRLASAAPDVEALPDTGDVPAIVLSGMQPSTGETHAFRTGATVIGVSLDNINRLNAFSADPLYCAGKVPVASDADGKLADSYHLKIDPEEHGFKDTRGVEVGHGFAERTTFVVSSDGIIAATIGGLAPATNVDRALAAVQRLAGAGQPAKK